jgi:hypothetical protein
VNHTWESRGDSRAMLYVLEAWICDRDCAAHGSAENGMFAAESVASLVGPGED